MRLRTKFDREDVIYFLNRNEIQSAPVEEIIVHITGVSVDEQLDAKRTVNIKIAYVVTDFMMPQELRDQLKIDNAPQIEITQGDAYASIELLLEGVAKKYQRSVAAELAEDETATTGAVEDEREEVNFP